MADYIRALKFPIVSWVLGDSLVLILLNLRIPGVFDLFREPFFGLFAAAIGLWAGYKMVQLGGNFLDGILAGVIVGAVCAVLRLTEIGYVTGGVPGFIAGIPPAISLLVANILGAILGGGFAATK